MLCPKCEIEVEAFDVDSEVVETHNIAPLWDGGPLFEDLTWPTGLRVVSRWATFQPCGHKIEADGWTVTQFGYEAGPTDSQPI